MTFEETLAYVRAQAAAYLAASDDDEYDMLALAAHREILRVAHSEGFRGDARAMHRLLTGDYDNEADADLDEEPYIWHDLEVLTDELMAQLDRHELPPRTTQLYQTWLREAFGAQ